ADDALSTMILAVTSKRIICPSMNTNMYDNRAVQRNLDILEDDGFVIVEPGTGELACKTSGAGRLPDPRLIFDRVVHALTLKDLRGKNVLISAGPTREAIDPVRYISNHSSGKMGYCLADAAEKRGAGVTLVSGPVMLDTPVGVDRVNVETAADMAEAILSRMETADIVIKVAAVADYRPAMTEEKKIKKQNQNQDGIVLALTENLDILKAVGEKKRHQFVAGFAAETDDLEKNALAKMTKKNLDMIAANLVGAPDSGFQADTNKVKLFFRDGQVVDIPLLEKRKIAHMILDTIVPRIDSTGKKQAFPPGSNRRGQSEE
ncbi:MAG TPA: bifunctional phosphopantothenoylcysteine decarboxylase/phosphopantothenate--cysteine ligase CoaBC, partial [Desulfobacteraceae bacterium]|nr:bifunctional phosphopantothenoylcysteine decarboxylase/phosphopantothenate--cysteine ligase CoaBC [Desulfobacteraceae bacterium]